MNKPPVNLQALPALLVDDRPRIARATIDNQRAVILDGLHTSREVSDTLAAVNGKPWLPVGLDGIRANHTHDGPVGSWRLTAHSQSFADALWRRLQPVVAAHRRFDAYANTDWDGHPNWTAVGVNPMLRFIRYESGGALVPHYDAAYIDATDDLRTLVTIVIYLEGPTRPGDGGATRFIADPQMMRPYADRDFSDWGRFARDDEVHTAVVGQPGRALLFDHRILHDSQEIIGHAARKTIIRTDLLFRRS